MKSCLMVKEEPLCADGGAPLLLKGSIVRLLGTLSRGAEREREKGSACRLAR